jgi:hypothetical protein
MNNMNSPITIINIVYDYIHKVPHLLKTTTVELLFQCFKDIRINKKFYTPKKLLYLIETTVFVIRFNQKILTYQEIRNYFYKYIKIDELHLVTEDEVYSFLNRVFSLGLQRFCEKSANSLDKYFEKFLLSFNKDLPKVNLKVNPIVHGLYNKL